MLGGLSPPMLTVVTSEEVKSDWTCREGASESSTICPELLVPPESAT